MKSEHRHELQTNELSKLGRRIGRFLQEFGSRLLAISAAVIVVVIVAGWWWMSSRAASANGWERFALAQSAEDYAEVAEEFEGQAVGAWARLAQAEQYLRDGIELSFTDRSAAVSELQDARKDFQTLINDKSVPDPVRQRALIGQARCLETLSAGSTQDDDAPSTDDAVRAYRQLTEEFPNSTYARLAESRIEALESESAKEFYAWFHKQQPKPEPPAEPEDGGATGEVSPHDFDNLDSLIPPEPEASEGGSTPAIPEFEIPEGFGESTESEESGETDQTEESDESETTPDAASSDSEGAGDEGQSQPTSNGAGDAESQPETAASGDTPRNSDASNSQPSVDETSPNAPDDVPPQPESNGSQADDS